MTEQLAFDALLQRFRTESISERDKGDRFERLMQLYLMTDPKYANTIKKVWLWKEFPGRGDFGGSDMGIDLVAETLDGDYWAIQCKCYQPGITIDKPAVDSFLAASGKQFLGIDHSHKRFTHRVWISTTNKWGSKAIEAIHNQRPPVTRINLFDLREAPVDWSKLENGIYGDQSRTPKKTLRPHQTTALEKVVRHFDANDRGKLIMACGTGKTFTSLRIAERLTRGNGLVLFLVPSIALLGQTLREWSADANEPIKAICVCSDVEVSKRKTKNDDTDTFSVVDLALPATTNAGEVAKQIGSYQTSGKSGLTVIFSTYQSIDVISKAQNLVSKESGVTSEFDLIVCDEAHRTTGVTLADEDESSFTKVHNDFFISASKRMYMTATPRLYSDDIKSKAAQAEAILCSMDDESLYGAEMYRIGFGEAVDKGLLTDYKVLVLTLSDRDIPDKIQTMFAKDSKEFNLDDATKLIGCINALSKQILGDEGIIKDTDPHPMKRAVAFCPKIVASKKITEVFNGVSGVYVDELPEEKRPHMVAVSSKHIDGTMSAPVRDELLGWLKSEGNENECRILTNVRCLSEGVDVPSLDAVMFLSARNSQVDVVQSVGRVMRTAPGKKYGYIVIPVVVPSNVEADKALDDNERYKVVWTVLNALRAHDDRFNATVNKIELNKKRPEQILVGTAEVAWEKGEAVIKNAETVSTLGQQLTLQFEELKSVVFARLVKKVGDRRYWEQWAKSVAQIAERQIERINYLIDEYKEHGDAFEKFLGGLRRNINPSITRQEAVEMLSQHIITKPVFEALFEGYSFVKNNPISVSMQQMLELLEAQAAEQDTETLQRFYESVKMRASNIDNSEAQQKIIVELYDKFFKTAFPKMVERLGIVYTPVEVVDFIINSVDDVLKKEFGRSLSDENIHILDPFTGTGTFVTRLIQSGLIKKEDLLRKYKNEIHANEIVLLAYYIAAVNIENAFHDALDTDDYVPFDGICLTDTFQLGETDGMIVADTFQENSERVSKQKNAPLRVIIGNPPYSVGQKSANDNAQNQKYPKLDRRIAETYAALTNATNKNSLYNSYIKAFRWSSDRLGNDGGVVCFVSDGGWLDSSSSNGFRKTLEKEFSSIYVFNLRGNARKSGELRQREAGNVFGGGSRSSIAITLLVKNPGVTSEKATIFYRDIGDYLSREQKLLSVQGLTSSPITNNAFESLNSSENGDWISVRNAGFSNYLPIQSESKFNNQACSFFVLNSRGVESARDAWVYGFSNAHLAQKMTSTIAYYNDVLSRFASGELETGNREVSIMDPNRISWSSSLFSSCELGKTTWFNGKNVRTAIYRPFIKQKLYFGDLFIHRRGQFDVILPNHTSRVPTICLSGIGVVKDFSAMLVNCHPDLELVGKSQCFPLYYYEENKGQTRSLFDQNGDDDYTRRDGVSDFILERARKQYGAKNISKEDIFYYVYGFLHSPEYRETFANDLKKSLPRLPLVDDVRDFWAFSNAGRELGELHVNYENVPPHPDVVVTGAESNFFTVQKMRFPAKNQKDTILYNSRITVSNIPAEAYEYVVNGKSAIEWIMERYQVTVHKESKIKNDPNDWAVDVGNPRYILDLLLSVINVSTQTVEIVNGLPKMKFE